MKAFVRRGIITLEPENHLEAEELKVLEKGNVSVSAVWHGYPQGDGRFPFLTTESVAVVNICYKDRL